MTKQHFDQSFALKDAPENYERFFVPAIGEPVAEDLIQRAGLRPGERVLDVACGTGIVARHALRQIGENGTVTGLDINPGMLAVARSIDSSIEWVEASAEAMPLPDESFDTVLCQLSLQFMENRPAALSEMRRVLTSGGRILLNLPGPAGPPFADFANIAEDTMGREAAGFIRQVFSLHDTGEIHNLMSEAGFHEIDTRSQKLKFSLPEPGEFLWQYVHSTPLVGLMAETDKTVRNELERKVIAKWQDYVKNGAFIYEQRIVTAVARK